MYKKLGLVREESETIGEFRERAHTVADEEQLAFLDTYERLLYSDMQADDHMRKELEERRKTLRAYIRKKKKELKEEEPCEDDA